MKHQLICNNHSTRLLLIFAGWGMDAGVFAGLSRSGYDIMVVWDYTSLHIDWNCIAQYDEVCLLAWSLGVYAATKTTHAINYKITRRIAVNGTTHPIDDRLGIPVDTFYGTLAGLNEASLRKFQRRMCVDREDYARFCAHLPQRPVDELINELQAVADSLILCVPGVTDWDMAFVGRDDRIFPPINQRRAWLEAGVEVRILNCGHYPDFERIIAEHFIDKVAMEQRFGRGMATYSANATVQSEVIDRMMVMLRNSNILKGMQNRVSEVLEIGSGSGLLTRRIVDFAPKALLTLWDMAADKPEGLPETTRMLKCDAEMQIHRIEPESFDCIFSASTMQWFNSPRHFLEGCAAALKPGGCAVLSTFVEGNLHQIKNLTGSSLPLLRPDELLRMAGEHFDIVASSVYERDLDFDSPLDVLRHLRLTGVNSLGDGQETARALTIAKRYPMMLDGRFHLTYRPMILILSKK